MLAIVGVVRRYSSARAYRILGRRHAGAELGAIALAVLRMISAANSGRLPTRSGLDKLWAGVGKLSHALGISASKIALSSIADLY